MEDALQQCALQDSDQGVAKMAMEALATANATAKGSRAETCLQAMVKELKESTSSMTSAGISGAAAVLQRCPPFPRCEVPKPLKFLRPHYSTLTEHYAKDGQCICSIFGRVCLRRTFSTHDARLIQSEIRKQLECSTQDMGRSPANQTCKCWQR